VEHVPDQGSGLRLPDIEQLDRDLRNTRLPGAHFSITPQDLSTVAGLVDGTYSVPSPIFALVAALRGLGITLDEMCRLCGSSLAAGPMLGECTLRLDSDLKVGIAYRTEVTLHGIDRKFSAVRGVIDRFRFSVVLFLPGSGRVAEVDLTWLLPRGPA
jgi:hypothetical protein